MSKRRESMRVAGWLAIAAGLSAVALAMVSTELWADVLGAYGLLFFLTGAWAVGGIALLGGYERRAARAEATARISADPRETVSR
jgi:hypothetical protein